jgi:hypothetical protein
MPADSAINQPNPIAPAAVAPVPVTDTPIPSFPPIDDIAPPPPPVMTQNAPDQPTDTSPPMTSGPGRRKLGKNGKIIATVLGILLLVGGVGAGVVLVQQQQEIREKAADPCCGGNVDCMTWDCTDAGMRQQWCQKNMGQNYCGQTGSCGDCPSEQPAPAAPTSTCSDSKKDQTGACNPACCGSDADCPSGQKCNISNGYCRSGKSCNPETTTPTTTTAPTTTTTGNCIDPNNSATFKSEGASCDRSCGDAACDGSGPLGCNYCDDTTNANGQFRCTLEPTSNPTRYKAACGGSAPGAISSSTSATHCLNNKDTNYAASLVAGSFVGGCGSFGCKSTERAVAKSTSLDPNAPCDFVCIETASCTGGTSPIDDTAPTVVNASRASCSGDCCETKVDDCWAVLQACPGGEIPCLTQVGGTGSKKCVDRSYCGSQQVDIRCNDGTVAGYVISINTCVATTPTTKTLVTPIPTAGTPGTTPPSTPPPGVSIVSQCLEIRAYDTNWTQLTVNDLTGLAAGDTVYFSVIGTASSGIIDQARFSINNGPWQVTTDKRTGTNEFYIQYTLPSGITTFTISAEIHHNTLGWF